jgi:transposase
MGCSTTHRERKESSVKTIVLRLEHRVKLKLRRLRRETKDKGLAVRCQIVLLAAKQQRPPSSRPRRRRRRQEIAEAVGCSPSWVNRVVARFRDAGVAGLLDRREDNGVTKLDEWYLSVLYDVVDGSPQDYGYPRPTWTRELLAKVMRTLTGVGVHPATMSRALAAIKARLGRPRPTVGCPWPRAARERRLAEVAAAVDPAALPKGHVAVYLDEVDVHLNPKVGLDWMNRGTQKQVPTPGKNQKRYLCGALDAASGLLSWVKAERKNSLLFVAMLRKLADEVYPDAAVIHVVLDNFGIHDSKISRAAVEELGGRVVLHFLPPYCPQANRIERVWLDLHANVTRNHRCLDMDGLMRNVVHYLMSRNARTRAKLKKVA